MVQLVVFAVLTLVNLTIVFALVLRSLRRQKEKAEEDFRRHTEAYIQDLRVQLRASEQEVEALANRWSHAQLKVLVSRVRSLRLERELRTTEESIRLYIEKETRLKSQIRSLEADLSQASTPRRRVSRISRPTPDTLNREE